MQRPQTRVDDSLRCRRAARDDKLPARFREVVFDARVEFYL